MKGKTVRISRMPTKTSWALALETLRVDIAGVPVSHLEQQGIMRCRSYRALLKSQRSPTVWKMDQILRGLNCTWWDWGEIYKPSEVRFEPGSQTRSRPRRQAKAAV